MSGPGFESGLPGSANAATSSARPPSPSGYQRPVRASSETVRTPFSRVRMARRLSFGTTVSATNGFVAPATRTRAAYAIHLGMGASREVRDLQATAAINWTTTIATFVTNGDITRRWTPFDFDDKLPDHGSALVPRPRALDRRRALLAMARAAGGARDSPVDRSSVCIQRVQPSAVAAHWRNPFRAGRLEAQYDRLGLQR